MLLETFKFLQGFALKNINFDRHYFVTITQLCNTIGVI